MAPTTLTTSSLFHLGVFLHSYCETRKPRIHRFTMGYLEFMAGGYLMPCAGCRPVMLSFVCNDSTFVFVAVFPGKRRTPASKSTPPPRGVHVVSQETGEPHIPSQRDSDSFQIVPTMSESSHDPPIQQPGGPGKVSPQFSNQRITLLTGERDLHHVSDFSTGNAKQLVEDLDVVRTQFFNN